MKRAGGALACFLVCALWPAGQALAIQGIGLSPTSQEVLLDPGTVKHGQITVINDGDKDVSYHIYATDYRVFGESYQGLFDNTGRGSSLSAVSWFGLPAGKQIIKARQEVPFPYTLSAPKTAAVGGHYAAVFIETIPPAATGSAHISRIDRVGSLFYIAVNGALDKRGNVLPLTAPWLQAAPPLTAAARVQNTGNVHFQTVITAQLASPFGKVGTPETSRGEVLPGTVRRFDLNLRSSSPIGLYKINVTLDYLGRTEHQSRWVLLVPRLTFIIVAATLILLLLGILWRLVQRDNKPARP